jgi:ADP-heptose:LPS heptosyltransferase
LRVLVIRFSSIGDIVLTTPVIRCLKNQLPVNSIVHFLTKPSFEFLLIQNPFIDKVHLLKPKLSDTIEEIKSLKFDYIIDLHANLRTFLIKIRCGIPSYTFNKLNFNKFLLTTFKINTLPQVHIVDRYFLAVKKLNIVNDNEGLDYFYPISSSVLSQKFPELEVNPFVSMAIGGQHFTKRMPAAKLSEVIQYSDYKIVLLGGKEDVEVANDLEQKCAKKLINLVGKLNLDESAGVVNMSKALITHDTGMMHIAAALFKPVFAIWGNTVPQFGMQAYYGHKKVLFKNFEVLGLNCRPCSKLGFNQCPKGHFNCMNNQQTKLISDSINAL